MENYLETQPGASEAGSAGWSPAPDLSASRGVSAWVLGHDRATLEGEKHGAKTRPSDPGRRSAFAAPACEPGPSSSSSMEPLLERWLWLFETPDSVPVWTGDLLPQFLPWLGMLFTVRFAPGGATRIGLFGTKLAPHFGDLTGRSFAEDLLGPGSGRIELDCRTALRGGGAVWSDDEIRHESGAVIACERILLPFAGAAGGIDRLLGCLAADTSGLPRNWVGGIRKFIPIRRTLVS